MAEYRVSWSIDVEADSLLDAAEQAFASMQDPDTLATIFTVKNDKDKEFTVDMKFGDAKARIIDVATGEVTYRDL